ncbi:hypothetical protein NUV25_00700 [Burkholderia pseudomultivorans]|uniref:hypothetical protein n=1 Tax=Burkholderia pseudomultivorans TaxID=1207504 RepID=UPI002875E304|nr:hypothetical protein [Burkholderia pseudomultivorans]MDS0856214.1 hypothetical protein [Burkholderia pseudomultivorans]
MNRTLKQMLSLVALGLACAATDSRAQGGVAGSGEVACVFGAGSAHIAKRGDEDAISRMHRELRYVSSGAAR